MITERMQELAGIPVNEKDGSYTLKNLLTSQLSADLKRIPRKFWSDTSIAPKYDITPRRGDELLLKLDFVNPKITKKEIKQFIAKSVGLGGANSPGRTVKIDVKKKTDNSIGISEFNIEIRY